VVVGNSCTHYYGTNLSFCSCKKIKSYGEDVKKLWTQMLNRIMELKIFMDVYLIRICSDRQNTVTCP